MRKKKHKKDQYRTKKNRDMIVKNKAMRKMICAEVPNEHQ